jgi:hypothetical protein
MLLRYRSIRYRQEENWHPDFSEIDGESIKPCTENSSGEKEAFVILLEEVLHWQPFYGLSQFI